MGTAGRAGTRGACQSVGACGKQVREREQGCLILTVGLQASLESQLDTPWEGARGFIRADALPCWGHTAAHEALPWASPTEMRLPERPRPVIDQLGVQRPGPFVSIRDNTEEPPGSRAQHGTGGRLPCNHTTGQLVPLPGRPASLPQGTPIHLTEPRLPVCFQGTPSGAVGRMVSGSSIWCAPGGSHLTCLRPSPPSFLPPPRRPLLWPPSSGGRVAGYPVTRARNTRVTPIQLLPSPPHYCTRHHVLSAALKSVSPHPSQGPAMAISCLDKEIDLFTGFPASSLVLLRSALPRLNTSPKYNSDLSPFSLIYTYICMNICMNRMHVLYIYNAHTVYDIHVYTHIRHM